MWRSVRQTHSLSLCAKLGLQPRRQARSSGVTGIWILCEDAFSRWARWGSTKRRNPTWNSAPGTFYEPTQHGQTKGAQQTPFAWIARGGCTQDPVFAPLPQMSGVKEVTTEEDREDRRLRLEAQKKVA
jgi:hypothetical protein